MLAIIPWVLTMTLILLNIHWEGIAGNGSWSNYLWRVSQIALIVYGGMTWALVRSRPHPRKSS
jgi:hypothetical protein